MVSSLKMGHTLSSLQFSKLFYWTKLQRWNAKFLIDLYPCMKYSIYIYVWRRTIHNRYEWMASLYLSCVTLWIWLCMREWMPKYIESKFRHSLPNWLVGHYFGIRNFVNWIELTLTNTWIMIYHAKNSITASFHMIVWANAAEHRR